MDARPIKERVREIAAQLDSMTDSEVFWALHGAMKSAPKPIKEVRIHSEITVYGDSGTILSGADAYETRYDIDCIRNIQHTSAYRFVDVPPGGESATSRNAK